MKERFLKFIETELGSGFMLITCGLPATGKTPIAEEISKVKGYPLLRSDLIRLDVLKNENIFDESVASNMNKRLMVYKEMFQQADRALIQSEGVILDATFVTQSLRRQVAAIAVRHNLKFIILETVCPEEVAIERILKRTKENYESSALTQQAYFNNKNRFEEVDLGDLKSLYPDLDIMHLKIDTQYDRPNNWYVVGMEKK